MSPVTTGNTEKCININQSINIYTSQPSKDILLYFKICLNTGAKTVP